MSRPQFVVALVLVGLSFMGVSLLAAEPPTKETKNQPAAAKSPCGKASSRAAAKSPVKKPRPHAANRRQLRTGEAAIEAALDKPAELDFFEMPLDDVIDYLKDCYGIEIQIDHKGLIGMGIGADMPVTISLQGLSLRLALNQMLRQLGLTWTIRDDVLFITTPEGEENELITKIYDVSDLVVCRDEHERLWDDYDTLIDSITSIVKPTSWDSIGGAGSITGASIGKAKLLIVSQTYHIHPQIVNLLAEIRKIAAKTPNAELPRRERPVPKTLHGCAASASPATALKPRTSAGDQSKEHPSEPTQGARGGGEF